MQFRDFELVLLLGDFKPTSKVVFLLLQLLWDEFEMASTYFSQKLSVFHFDFILTA